MSGFIPLRILYSAILAMLLGVAATVEAQVPMYLIEPGDESEYALVVDKKSQELLLYRGGSAFPYLEKRYKCTTGKNNNGSKHREGDEKTPNGIYFFRSILDDEQLPAKYGVRAFPMDYPNDVDRMLDKTGSGIWLHAVDEDERVEISYDTEGCVVVTNSDIMELSGYIELRRTPIIVDDSLFLLSEDELAGERERLAGFVENWRDAWESKDIERYIGCYDDDFYSYGRTKQQHRAHKARLNRLYKTIDVDLSDIRVFKYHDYAVVSFHQEYRSDRFRSTGPKKLYLVERPQGYRIITERMNR